MSISLKSKNDIEKMKIAGNYAAKVLEYLEDFVQVGISTEEIDNVAYKYITEELKCIPANVGYNDYPKTLCTSINDVICHGIPSDKEILKDGDIVNIDKVPSSTNPNALENLGFNGRFNVKSISANNRYEFTTTNEDIFGVSHNPGIATFDRHQRDINLPRISRSDAQTNLYVYRVETVSEYIKDVQDGIYYL